MKVKNEAVRIEEVEANLAQRDHLDSTREISPLRKAADAVDLDNSHLSMEQQLKIAYEWAMQKRQHT
jgi:cytidylate kinase